MTLNEFETIFNNIATNHIDIDAFVFGDAFEQVQEVLTNLGDVILLVDSPDFSTDNVNNTGRMLTYESDMVLLKLTKPESRTEKQNDLITTMDIIVEIERELDRQFQNNDFYEFNIRSNYKQTFIDNRIGWRAKFEIEFDVNVGINNDKWL